MVTLKRKTASVLIVAFVLALFLRLFIVEGFIVRGDSMSPTILSGDYVFINKLAYRSSEPLRGDIVVAVPRQEGFKVVKRIVVLPGERFVVRDGRILIQKDRTDAGTELNESYIQGSDIQWEEGKNPRKLDPQEYFALGDNVAVSIDSRELGFLDKWDIKGRVFGVFRFSILKYIGL